MYEPKNTTTYSTLHANINHHIPDSTQLSASTCCYVNPQPLNPQVVSVTSCFLQMILSDVPAVSLMIRLPALTSQPSQYNGTLPSTLPIEQCQDREEGSSGGRDREEGAAFLCRSPPLQLSVPPVYSAP
ncbi:hypothetical protein E2C01_029911 [Portunus trituberculatus]|uniref:Uncharacterized protein n=1 Tax=Portunus trituberculatus TaxID=210409 RepID=A0A5B7EU87_PORTR|nr:hypothetical protein [Portunus trituberculatus]